MLCLQKPKSLSLPRQCVHWRGDPFPKRTEPAFAPACTSYCQNQEEISAKKNPTSNEVGFGGDCWTRTSDLLRVKNCVMSCAGGHSRRVPLNHRPFASPQGLKLCTTAASYSLKSPTHSASQYLVKQTDTVQGRSQYDAKSDQISDRDIQSTIFCHAHE